MVISIKKESFCLTGHLYQTKSFKALAYIKLINSYKFDVLTDSGSTLQHVPRCSSYLRAPSIAYDII